MSEEPRLGDLGNAQRYTEAEVARIARAAAPFVRGEKDAGKVYCPFCKLREARWKRHGQAPDSPLISIFVYCTQCHRTGVSQIDLEAFAARRSRRTRWMYLVILILLAVTGAVIGSWIE